MINFCVGREEFLSTYFEKQFLLLRSAADVGDVSWDFINGLLYLVEPALPQFKLLHEGTLDEDVYAEDCDEFGVKRRRLKKEQFYGLMGAGATAIFNRIEVYSPYIKGLCMEVADFAGGNVAANAYLSYTGSGTFGKHWDTHDVFVIQLFGTKRWQVFEPTLPLPLRSQTSQNVKRTCPEEAVFDGVLEAGDVMYLPRGWWHVATPMDHVSFHVTVGMYYPNMMEYAAWCASKYLPEVLLARRSAHLDGMDQTDLDTLAELMRNAIANPLHYEEFRLERLLAERVVTPFNLERFTTERIVPLHDTRQIRLCSNLDTNLDRRYLRLNGSLSRRSQCDIDAIGVLAERRNLSVGLLRVSLAEHTPEAINATLEDLLKKNIISLI
ncbi:cupin domain-containing protein [Janthinobacterium sp. PAMC25594]|uniref:cupin domain-containing protein n=1 Tax=Janthinobacterium sp. PAMC25594 TaxID=2861284 RepID=UPI001C6372B1|nr:cupin domain-containing protein [Janthinobacterium sp. PAMC25594]QYG09825.1 cupin domain-containing protein [Janthinobacterium sp. PAMC25594]